MEINSLFDKILNYEGKNVKVIGDYNDPWFCARDICNILGYKNHKEVISRQIDDSDKKNLYNLGVSFKLTPNFTHNEGQAAYINESGLYQLILGCKLPLAKTFRKWITNEVLPTIRKEGEYKLTQKYEDTLSKHIELLSLKNKEINDKDKELEETQHKLEKSEKYNLRLKDFVTTMKSREETQVIYIATSQHYALNNRFKVGGVKNVDLLKGRLATYNTGRPKDDKLYFCFFVYCSDFKHLENRIKIIIGDHREQSDSEMYHLHYHSLKEIIEYMSERFSEEISMHKSKFEELIKETLNKEPFIPEPLILNGFEYRKWKNGKEVTVQKIDWDNMENEKAKLKFISEIFEEYLEGQNKPRSEIIIYRKDFEDYLAHIHKTKFNKIHLWNVTKQVAKEKSVNVKYK